MMRRGQVPLFWPASAAQAPPFRDCVAIARKGERQSGSKALGCGSFRLCEIVICMKSNVFIPLARLISNG